MSKQTNNIFYVILCIIFISNILGVVAYILRVTGKVTRKVTGKNETKYINKYTGIEGGVTLFDIIDGKKYKIHKFTKNGTGIDKFKIPTKNGELNFEIIIIGGGGGGGGASIWRTQQKGNSGGGGGGGDVKIKSNIKLSGDNNIYIGKGGSGGSGDDGENGGNTIIWSSTGTDLFATGGFGGKGGQDLYYEDNWRTAYDGGKSGNNKQGGFASQAPQTLGAYEASKGMPDMSVKNSNECQNAAGNVQWGGSSTIPSAPSGCIKTQHFTGNDNIPTYRFNGNTDKECGSNSYFGTADCIQKPVNINASGGGGGYGGKGGDGSETYIGGKGGDGFTIPKGWGSFTNQKVCGGGGGGEGGHTNAIIMGGSGTDGGGDAGKGNNNFNWDGQNAPYYGGGGGGASCLKKEVAGITNIVTGGDGHDGLVLIRYRIA